MIVAVLGVAFALAATDGMPPQTELLRTPPNPSSSPDAVFEFQGSDDTGVAGFLCQFTWDKDPTPCQSPVTYTGLADGTWTFSVRAVDTAGNQDPSPATHTWTIASGTPTPIPTPTAEAQPSPAAAPEVVPEKPCQVVRSRFFVARLFDERRVAIGVRHAATLRRIVLVQDKRVIARRRYARKTVAVELLDLPTGRFTARVTVRRKAGAEKTVAKVMRTCT